MLYFSLQLTSKINLNTIHERCLKKHIISNRFNPHRCSLNVRRIPRLRLFNLRNLFYKAFQLRLGCSGISHWHFSQCFSFATLAHVARCSAHPNHPSQSHRTYVHILSHQQRNPSFRRAHPFFTRKAWRCPSVNTRLWHRCHRKSSRHYLSTTRRRTHHYLALAQHHVIGTQPNRRLNLDGTQLRLLHSNRLWNLFTRWHNI